MTLRNCLIIITAAALAAPTLAHTRPEGEQPQSPLTRSSGASASALSWADVDGDGRLDLFALPPGETPRILRNAGEGRFEDVTNLSGLDAYAGASAALWHDVDRDGAPDLYLVGPGRLLRNVGGFAFEDATERAGLAEITPTLSAEWLDTDADGFPELLLAGPAGAHLYHISRGFEGQGSELDGAALAALLERESGNALRGGPDADGAPGTDGLDVPGGGPGAGGTGPSGRTSSAGGPGFEPACSLGITDQALPSDCIPASSAPVLGMLYPISIDWFVAPTGEVGIGTTAPGARLHVAGDSQVDGQVRITGSGAPLSVTSSELNINLNSDLLDGFEADDFSQLGSTIGTDELEPGAVTSSRLAANSVDGGKVVDGSLTSLDLAVGAVTSSELAANSVDGGKVVDGSLTGDEIQDGSLTSLDLAAGSVTSSELAANSVESSTVVDGSLTGIDIQNGSLTGNDIGDGSIQSTDLGSNCVGPIQLSAGAVSNVNVSALAAIDGTKIVPAFGNQDVSTIGVVQIGNGIGSEDYQVKAEGSLDADGYLGVQGTTDFDGVLSADWAGKEIGVVGLSTGTTNSDNFGLLGHSNGVGVRGEHAGNPTQDFAQLGLPGIGIHASGATLAGDFDGDVDIDGQIRMIIDHPDSAIHVHNESGGGFQFVATGDTNPGHGVSSIVQGPGMAGFFLQSLESADNPCVFINSRSTSDLHYSLYVDNVSTGSGKTAFFGTNRTEASGDTVSIRNRGTGDGLLVDAQGGGLAADMTATGNVLRLNNSSNTGSIIEVANLADVEFRVDSTGDVFCDSAFSGGGADYAEWLERLDPEEHLEPGDVIGVHGGRISRNLYGATQVLVISSDPVIIGNSLGAEEDEREGYEMVAFLGQVPVKVLGPVHVGDLLVPSGRNDGVALAVSPAALSPADVGRVIGTAWEDTDGQDQQLIIAAIGIDQARAAALALSALHDRLADIEARLSAQEQADTRARKRAREKRPRSRRRR